MWKYLVTLLALWLDLSAGLLYPRESETREIKSLDGMWKFATSPSLQPELGFQSKWFANQTVWQGNAYQLMPVPSSYNDITTEASLRDFVGWAWYFRTFFVPSSWKSKKVMLRFGSVHYTAQVWVNGQPVGGHSGGHLPFEMDISQNLDYWHENNITVAVNNTLTLHTIPQGEWQWMNNSHSANPFKLVYTFDFFNYAGIHRPVLLYTLPREIHIVDIDVMTTSINTSSHTATIAYDFSINSKSKESIQCSITILDHSGRKVAEEHSCQGSMEVENVTFWWPYLMHPNPGYLYTLSGWIHSISAGDDVYRLPFGIRMVEWNATNMMVNGKNFYFKGFGRHEDSDIRGKGLDLPLVTRDFELIKWIGANSFRTSHYPYAEEIMDFADQNGIVIIDECPGVNLHVFDSQLLENHKQVMRELIARDKNRPSVFTWSLANEPVSTEPAAEKYFQDIADFTRSIDPHKRPVMAVLSRDYYNDLATPSLDLYGINRYYSWYSDTGDLSVITSQLSTNLNNWRAKYPDKLFLITEYGGDTISGFHTLPSFIWTEDYQCDLMENYFEAFDQYRASHEGLVGEMIWNFADFMTKQDITRAVGNKKGIFTRQRQPKSSAKLLKERYWSLQ